MNKKNKIIEFSYNDKEYELEVVVSTYAVDDRSLYVGLIDSKTKEAFSDVTIYISGSYLEDNQAYVDPINEEIGILQKLKELDIITRTHDKKQYNYGNYTLASFNLDKLREYDIIGMRRIDKYSNIYDIEEKIDYDEYIEYDMDFKTKSGYFLHFHPNDYGYKFSYYDNDKNLIDEGTLDSEDFLSLKEILEGIVALLSKSDLDESLRDLTHISGLEKIYDTKKYREEYKI